MVDIFALSIAHGLLVLAAWRLMARDDLDSEGGSRPRFGSRRQPPLMAPDHGDEQP
jgi:hypothetical protein